RRGAEERVRGYRCRPETSPGRSRLDPVERRYRPLARRRAPERPSIAMALGRSRENVGKRLEIGRSAKLPKSPELPKTAKNLGDLWQFWHFWQFWPNRLLAAAHCLKCAQLGRVLETSLKITTAANRIRKTKAAW